MFLPSKAAQDWNTSAPSSVSSLSKNVRGIEIPQLGGRRKSDVYQDFLATPLSFPAERSPEEPLPEKLYCCRSATIPPTPAPRGSKAASPRAAVPLALPPHSKMAGIRGPPPLLLIPHPRIRV
jgi:hypothetical protein